MYIICIKDLISIYGAKFHPIILIVKFHMQFEKKTIAPNLSAHIHTHAHAHTRARARARAHILFVQKI